MKKQQSTTKRRRILSALTAAALSFAMLPLQTAAVEDEALIDADQILPGDVNGDDEVTVIDLIIIQGFLMGHDNVTMYAPWNADINGDDAVDIFDLALAKRIVLEGGSTTIPIGPADPDPTEPTDPQPTEPDPVPAVTEGKLYQRIGLTDQQAGVVAYEGLLPDGWTVQMYSNWQVISPLFPGQETVAYTSPDGKAVVTVTSPMFYQQSSNRDNGPNLSEYTTYMPYLTADQFIEYFIANNYTNAELTAELEVAADQQEAVEWFAQDRAQAFANGAASLGLNMQMQGYEGTVSRRQYSTENGPAEFTCAVAGYQYYYTIVAGFGITNIPWYSLNTVSFQAADQASFKKYYSDYEMIAANGWFTPQFFNCCNYVSTKIGTLILEARNEYVSGDPFKDYSETMNEVTAAERETSERVFQAWDDVIKEQDTYSLSDGTTLHVPTYVDTVASNGDSVYFGTSGGVPMGYDILTAN